MQLYRLCRQKYAELSGYGAKKAGGRWNRKGIAALYTAENSSLAVLEVLVHLDKAEIPTDYVLLEVSVPDTMVTQITDLSSKHLDILYQNGYRALEGNAIGFSIPSVIVPNDCVIVLYPDAPMSAEVLAITRITPFTFDERLFFPSALGW
ncbi:MAG: RES family NAD+ phosphorylase [Acidobacteriaceae bacterium]|nr:RES family NAD+ phosphorylase [Acidobacteriaceae bacterium]